MFTFEIKKAKIKILTSEILTAGMVNSIECHFKFLPDWDDIDKTVIFEGSGKKIAVTLDENSNVVIPNEVLKGNKNRIEHVYVSVYGTKGNQLIIPTIKADLGKLNEGASLEGTELDKAPPENVYAEIIDTVKKNEEVIETIKAAQQKGDLDGATFYPSVSYGVLTWTNNRGLENPKPVKITPDNAELDKSYIFTQNSASDYWLIPHELHKYPSVTIVDSAGTVVIGEVKYINKDHVEITFQAPFSGKAYLN